MSNYPPGVTGREFAIAGYDSEVEVERSCEAEEVSFEVISKAGKKKLMDLIHSAESGGGLLIDATALRGIQYELVDVDVDTCPFEGTVTIGWYQGQGTWTCPVCESEHTEEPDEPDWDAIAKEAPEDEI